MRRKLPIALSIALVLSSVSAAQTAEPSHPLSQITPIDVPLDMNNRNIQSVNSLQLQDGLVLRDNTLSGSLQQYRVVVDESQGSIKIRGGDLDIGSNNITQPGTIKTGGEPIVFKDGAQPVLRLNQNGNVDIPNGKLGVKDARIETFASSGDENLVLKSARTDQDITLQIQESTNSIIGFHPPSSEQIVNFSAGGTRIEKGDLTIPASSGNIVLNGNNIQSPGNVDGVDIDNPGNAINIVNNRMQIPVNGVSSDEINLGAISGTGISHTTELNAEGQQIVQSLVNQGENGVDDQLALKDEEGTNYGSITIDDDFEPDTVNTQSLSDVLSVGNSAGSNSINMNQNDIDSADRLTAETGIGAGVTDATRDSQLGTGTVVYADGDIEVTGNIRGSGGDVAEIVASDETLEKGEVASVKSNATVTESTQRYSTKAIGIVSTEPGVILAKNKTGSKIALTGIVPVKTTVSNGKISPGDLLTTSSKPGTAMKCKKTSKCEGAIVGKSLEGAEQNGKVKAIVTLD